MSSSLGVGFRDFRVFSYTHWIPATPTYPFAEIKTNDRMWKFIFDFGEGLSFARGRMLDDSPFYFLFGTIVCPPTTHYM